MGLSGQKFIFYTLIELNTSRKAELKTIMLTVFAKFSLRGLLVP